MPEGLYRLVTTITRPDGERTTTFGEPLSKPLAEAWCAHLNAERNHTLTVVTRIEPVGESDE